MRLKRPLKALITGAGGLIGSACVEHLAERGWDITGLDNDMRREFFGESGSTAPVIADLEKRIPQYTHVWADIRDRQMIRNIMKDERPNFIIHAAAQPSHEMSATIPYTDFDVNAVGTLNILVAARDYCRDSPFCFTSTNKVYGDRPNSIPLIESELRYNYADGRDGIDESMSIDASLHSPFGASKVAADVLCQEFGRYFQMPIGIFRCGCLSGPQHAAVELHGYLAFIVFAAVRGKDYRVHGYGGKQVRDQIHCRDVARLFFEYFRLPRPGEVYNLGGGRPNSLSVLETIAILEELGHPLSYTIDEQNRKGDHICYITDLAKIRAHFPHWQIEVSVREMIQDIACRHSTDLRAAPASASASSPSGRLPA